ncbi:hypothetical protein GOC23_30080 [Sinorhizobium meliloti]|nr:hypothetical protein [Sinorhizobium meliloti]
MRFIRNWLLPILSAAVGALPGFMVIGLPGFNVIMTIHETPMPAGIPPEQISTILAQGKKIVSYIDFYGVHLPGEPFSWSIGVIAGMTFVGYGLEARVRGA